MDLRFYGPATAERFTRRYLARSSADPATPPLWDLAAALRPAGQLAEWAHGDAARATKMRNDRLAFTNDALERSAGWIS